jgi:hypothetical protein
MQEEMVAVPPAATDPHTRTATPASASTASARSAADARSALNSALASTAATSWPARSHSGASTEAMRALCPARPEAEEATPPGAAVAAPGRVGAPTLPTLLSGRLSWWLAATARLGCPSSCPLLCQQPHNPCTTFTFFALPGLGSPHPTPHSPDGV